MKLERIALIMVFVVGIVIGFNGVTWSRPEYGVVKIKREMEAFRKRKESAMNRGYKLIRVKDERTWPKSGEKAIMGKYTHEYKWVEVKMSDSERMAWESTRESLEITRARKAERVRKFLEEEKREKGEVSQGKPNAYYSATVSKRNDDKLDGKVTLSFPGGSKYVGFWKDGNRNGHGTNTFPGGSKYVGEWKDDNRNGHGTQTFPDGSKYVGGWKDGKMYGQGTYTWANGHKYVGEWKDNKKHGQGTHTFPSGKKYEGEWRDDKFVE